MQQLFTSYRNSFRYESSTQKSANANLPVLGTKMNVPEDNTTLDQRLPPSSSIERPTEERKRDIVPRQQSSSSYFEKQSQHQSSVQKDEDGDSRGSGIEELH